MGKVTSTASSHGDPSVGRVCAAGTWRYARSFGEIVPASTVGSERLPWMRTLETYGEILIVGLGVEGDVHFSASALHLALLLRTQLRVLPTNDSVRTKVGW
jgi:hypothetical protein